MHGNSAIGVLRDSFLCTWRGAVLVLLGFIMAAPRDDNGTERLELEGYYLGL